MPYVRGDYVRPGQSNYSRGDPFLGAVVGAVARRVVAPLARKAGRWIGRQTLGGAIAKGAGAAATAATLAPVVRAVGGGSATITPTAILPGGESFIEFNPGRKKYRRMNPLNPRALKRALRRAEGFEKFARRTVNALRSGPKKFKKQTTTRG